MDIKIRNLVHKSIFLSVAENHCNILVNLATTSYIYCSVWISPPQDLSLIRPTLDQLALKSRALRTIFCHDLISTHTSHILT